MGNEFKKIQLRSIILFASLILGIALYIIVLLTGRSNIFMQENAASLVRASNRQMELNIDSYLNKVRKASALLFSDSTSYTYDPSDDSVDDYTKLHAFSKILDEENNSDAWVFGLNGDTAHIYYFERYNSYAIILISFYSRELKGVFQIPEQLDGMEVSLVNNDNRILYSNEDEKIGSNLPESTISLLNNLKNGSVMTNTLLITSDECSNGWCVVCTVPASLIIQDNTRFMEVTIIVILAFVAVILIFGVVVTKRMNVTANHYVDSLEDEAQHDRMTGLYNREEFHLIADAFIKEKPAGKTMSFSIFDMDHFKSINDQHGHLEGDEVLRRFSKLLSDTFGSEFILGRLGGDEFGVFGCIDILDEMRAITELKKYIAALRHSFNKSLAKDYSVDSLSFCSGTAIVHKSDLNFTDVFNRADTLLYLGKKNGKSQDHFDDEGNENP